ncbi:MAG: 30S ribosomal protein S12 methylthiotransferase RimO [Bacteroidales bacterium]|jgi:ribosomal protein S12 methylthiotransferase|nr:30S ribosomal protein S12 methylthiotransferase RimO [Bacteroidales bacterium]
MTINIITLGCSKNNVDSEALAARFAKMGHQVFFESDAPSDIVLVNTCCFIQDAKEESIEEILSRTERKKRGEVGQVFVVGCMVQRYKEELRSALPEVDGFYSFAELPDLLNTQSFDLLTEPRDLLSTPAHYAYLKVSEGCDRQCSFCAIPLIRGKQVSKRVEQIVFEAEQLARRGVKEIMLIAQDLTAYGTDIYHEKALKTLLSSLARVQGLQWIRLHYAYPNDFPFPILDVLQENKVFCRYIDMPLQHVSERILRDMRRPSSPGKLRALIEHIREKIPGIAIRTTLLTGFPGETLAEHEELKRFVQEIKFDRLGVFSYSREENTAAYAWKDNVSPREKRRRQKELMQIQEKISLTNNQLKIGQCLPVIIDRENEDFYEGRTEFDSPEVDNLVRIKKQTILNIGDIYPVRISKANAYDLYGTVEMERN